MKQSQVKSKIIAVVLLAGLLPWLVSLAASFLFGAAPHVQEPLHEFSELAGSCIGLMMASLLLLITRHEDRSTQHLFWVMAGLVAMGVLDGVHSVVPWDVAPGRGWLRHGATLVGGVFFGLVWVRLPASLVRRKQFYLIMVVAVLAMLGALGIVWRHELLPATWVQGNYSFPVKAANALGGLGFLAAAAFFSRRYLRRPRMEDMALASHTLIFGAAGLFFGFSHMWAADWWVWHGFRLLAYSILLAVGYKVVITFITELRENRELFKVITSNTPDHLLVQDAELRYLLVMNPQLGLTEQDMIGKTDYDFLSKEDADKLTTIKRQVLKTSGSIHIEVPLTSPNGEQQFFSGTYIPKFDVKGQVDGLIGYFRNVTDRKQSENDLKISEEKYRMILENMEEGYHEVDLPGNFTFFNESFQKLIGYPHEELMGMNSRHYAADEANRKKVFEAYNRVFKTGEPLDSFAWDIIRKDGDRRTVEVSVSLITGKDNSPTGFRGIVRDITERKQAEEVIRQAEENYHNFIDNSMMGIRIVTSDGETLYANTALLDIYEYDSLDELKTTPIINRYTPESLAEHQIRREKRKRGDDDPSEYEISIIRKDGEIRHLQVFRKTIIWDDKKQFQVLYRDITDCKRADEELQESEERYRSLFENMLNGFAYCKMLFDDHDRPVDFVFLAVNKAFEKLTGLKNVLQKKFTELIPGIGDAVPEMFEVYGRVTLTGIPERFEIYSDTFGGWLYIYAHSAGKGCFVAVFENITERKRAEEEIKHTHAQMRAFAGRLQAVREEERTQIAREIHDELGGALTGLKIEFSMLTRSVGKIKEASLKHHLLDRVYDTTKLIDKTIQTVRRIATELRPGILDDLGIIAALEWQLKDFQKRTGIRCEWISSEEQINMDEKQSTALFRIFQETLTNVARHAEATEVRIYLRTEANAYVLEVGDNGRGITIDKLEDTKSLGLLGMRERTLAFGGRIAVEGHPGRGTKVTVEIPFKEINNRTSGQEGGAQ
jgi:PAS domain S-box-containing protein